MKPCPEQRQPRLLPRFYFRQRTESDRDPARASTVPLPRDGKAEPKRTSEPTCGTSDNRNAIGRNANRQCILNGNALVDLQSRRTNSETALTPL